MKTGKGTLPNEKYRYTVFGISGYGQHAWRRENLECLMNIIFCPGDLRKEGGRMLPNLEGTC
jgi:hypothetical protein